MSFYTYKEAKYFKQNIFFPIIRSENNSFKYWALVGIGGNIGSTEKIFRNVFRFWQKDKRIKVIETSQILINEAFGYKKQNDFYNSVMLIQTSMDAKKFLLFLLHTEKIFKRKRSFINSPRTLDLDIIFFDNQKHNRKNLIVPHPKWQERLSVIIPMGMLKRV